MLHAKKYRIFYLMIRVQDIWTEKAFLVSF